MPLELGLWRIDDGLKQVTESSLDSERRLEDTLSKDIQITSPNWMLIGRQVYNEMTLSSFFCPDVVAVDF